MNNLRSSTHVALATALAASLGISAPAAAFDAAVSGTKLLIKDRANKRRDSQLRFVVLGDGGVAKGPESPAGDGAGLSATLHLFFADAPGRFVSSLAMPGPWRSNSGAIARFDNPGAPNDASPIRRASVRNGRSIRVAARGLGAATLPEDGPTEDGGITAVLTVHNSHDGSTHRMCTRFATNAGSTVSMRATRRGRRLLAKDGVPTECDLQLTLAGAADCDFLNQVECLLPYPSSRFEVAADTATGVRLNVPASGLPMVDGPPLPAESANKFDGFSPGAQILMHFPQGVDPALSGASRLLSPECCDQPPGPPWIDTRTHTDRSLDPDSPTILIDADTGERVLHFIEPDVRAIGPERQVVFLRPGRILDTGHRYIVAMRNLVAPDGRPVVAEAAFAALRAGIATDSPEVEERRPEMEALFETLSSYGIPRDDLVLAFDFTVRSQEQLTYKILSMRDQAYAWLDAVDADPGAVPFVVESVSERDCTQPNETVWRRIHGTFSSPLFLTGDLEEDSVQFANLDMSGTPVPNGFTDPEFTITVPCAALEGAGRVSALDPLFPLLVGHGLFGRGNGFVDEVTALASRLPPWRGIVGGTDWRGLSGPDLLWVGSQVIGLGASQLHNFEALPDRLRQGMLNTLVLSRLMKLGLFNRDPAFQLPSGAGVFPGPSEEMFYLGGSLGGIMGTYLAGLDPDIVRFVLEVGAVNFSCLLQRATPFVSFDVLLPGVGVTDPMSFAQVLAAGHELWADADPTSVVHHVTSDPLPGSGGPKRVLMSTAFLDHQVSNNCSEIAARTMGLPNLVGSISQGIPGIPDVEGPLDSAYSLWHLGEIDILNPAHQTSVPPLANRVATGPCDPHGRRSTSLAALQQMTQFLQPGGQIVNTCTGLCDGATDNERAARVCTP